jgi:hypothetical protein
MNNKMNKFENKEQVHVCGVNLSKQMKLLSPQLVKESIEQQQIDNERIKRQEKARLERQLFRDTEPIKEEYNKYYACLEEQERTCKTVTMDDILEMVHPVEDFVLQCNYPLVFESDK